MPAVRTITLAVSAAKAVEAARNLLSYAEEQRRERAGGFPTTSSPDPDADWGVAALIVEQASQHLAEALPNGQLMRSAAALGALKIGVDLLAESLGERGVGPAIPQDASAKEG